MFADRHYTEDEIGSLSNLHRLIFQLCNTIQHMKNDWPEKNQPF